MSMQHTPHHHERSAMTEAQAPGWTEERIAQLILSSGAHSDPSEGHCLLEVVSMFAGETFSDHPVCVDYVLVEFGRSWNDGMRSDAEREQLKRYIPLLPGTAKGEALSQQRAFMAVDWTIRVNTPAWLDLSPALAEHAAALRALAPILGEQQLADALPTLERAKAASAAAKDAAWAAAGNAAKDAAWAAAGNAAGAAAGDAAKDAAWDAARAAARAAAWGAAGNSAWAAARDAAQKGLSYGAQVNAARSVMDAALQPTVEKLQISAHDLYLSMIKATGGAA
jgi:hypothetical protein